MSHTAEAQRQAALAKLLNVSAEMSPDDRISECIAAWSLKVPHFQITRCITESLETLKQTATYPAIKIGSRMTLTSQCIQLLTLCFNIIGVLFGLFCLHGLSLQVASFTYGLTTLFCNVGWILYCIWHAFSVCWCTVKAIPGLLKSCWYNDPVVWSYLENLWTPPSAQAEITQNGGLWSWVAGTQQTSVNTTFNVNLGCIALVCYLVAMCLIFCLLNLVFSQLTKILSKVYNGISYLFNWLAACSWVEKTRSHVSNRFTDAFTWVATQCSRFVSFVWKGITKFDISSMCVTLVNFFHDACRFNSNEVDASKEAQKLTTDKAAFGKVFCTFLIKLTTKATSAFGTDPLMATSDDNMDAHLIDAHLMENIAKIRANQANLNLDIPHLNTCFFSCHHFDKDHEKTSKQLGGIDIKREYSDALDCYRRNRNRPSSAKKYYGIKTDYEVYTNNIYEDIKRKGTQLRYYEYFALIVLLLLLLGFGYNAYHQLQVKDRTFMINSKAQEQALLINGQEMFLRTDQRQCFRKQSIFNDCMPPHLFRAYKTAHNATIQHFRKMDNANRTRCIENHTATETDKPWFLGKLLAFFVSDDVSDESAPIEHQCLPLKEKDADLEKEEGFVHELEGRFHNERAKAGLSLDLMFLSQSRICLKTVSKDFTAVTEAYKSPIAKALSAPDYGLRTFLTLVADAHTSIHYCELGSVALKFTLMVVFPVMLLMSLVNWLLALNYNNSL